MSASVFDSSIPQPLRQRFDSGRALAVVVEAMKGTIAQGIPLLLLTIVPTVLIGGVVAGGIFLSGIAAAAGSVVGVGGFILGGVIALAAMTAAFVLYAASMAGTVLVIEDERGGRVARNFEKAFKDGWSHAPNALMAMLMHLFVVAVAFTPTFVVGAIALATAPVGPIAVGVAAVLNVPLVLWVVLRTSLMMPVSILDGEGALDALSTSFALTKGKLFPIVLVMLLAWIAATAVASLGALIAGIPVVGWIIAICAQLLLQAFAIAVTVHTREACMADPQL